MCKMVFIYRHFRKQKYEQTITTTAPSRMSPITVTRATEKRNQMYWYTAILLF